MHTTMSVRQIYLTTKLHAWSTLLRDYGTRPSSESSRSSWNKVMSLFSKEKATVEENHHSTTMMTTTMPKKEPAPSTHTASLAQLRKRKELEQQEPRPTIDQVKEALKPLILTSFPDATEASWQELSFKDNLEAKCHILSSLVRHFRRSIPDSALALLNTPAEVIHFMSQLASPLSPVKIKVVGDPMKEIFGPSTALPPNVRVEVYRNNRTRKAHMLQEMKTYFKKSLMTPSQ